MVKYFFESSFKFFRSMRKIRKKKDFLVELKKIEVFCKLPILKLDLDLKKIEA